MPQTQSDSWSFQIEVGNKPKKLGKIHDMTWQKNDFQTVPNLLLVNGIGKWIVEENTIYMLLVLVPCTM